MSNQPNPVSLEDVKASIEAYGTTIMALQAMICFMKSQSIINGAGNEVRASIGRRMKTSNNNKIQPSTKITPDLVLQVDSTFGMVFEAKRLMPKNSNNQWQKCIDQMNKYDDDLLNWWTADGTIDSCNISLLMDSDWATEFSKYIQSFIDSDPNHQFLHPFSILEFYKKQELKQFLRIKKIWGNLSDPNIQGILESGHSELCESLIENLKFYDSEPEFVEYTMAILWQHVFSEKRTSVVFDEMMNAWPIKVSVLELTSEVQKSYGQNGISPNDPTFPHIGWIREALTAFVKLGLAEKLDVTDEFVIKYKLFHGVDIFEKFFKHRQKTKSEISSESQPVLFPQENLDSPSNTNIGSI